MLNLIKEILLEDARVKVQLNTPDKLDESHLRSVLEFEVMPHHRYICSFNVHPQAMKSWEKFDKEQAKELLVIHQHNPNTDSQVQKPVRTNYGYVFSVFIN